jgi:hypothetical protein
MPAASKTRPLGGRRTSDPDPFNVDMTEVPMTPAMTALHELGKLRAHVLLADHILEEMVLDGTEITLAEGQTATHAMRAQGRGFGWRAQLSRLFKGRRGIDPSKLNWRTRTRDLEPEEVPDYMAPEVLEALRTLAEPLSELLQKASAQRDKQYPAIHERTKPAIEGHTVKSKAS